MCPVCLLEAIAEKSITGTSATAVALKIVERWLCGIFARIHFRNVE